MWLGRVITLVLVLRHSNENHSKKKKMLLVIFIPKANEVSDVLLIFNKQNAFIWKENEGSSLTMTTTTTIFFLQAVKIKANTVYDNNITMI